jgi:hypothetical protein
MKDLVTDPEFLGWCALLFGWFACACFFSLFIWGVWWVLSLAFDSLRWAICRVLLWRERRKLLRAISLSEQNALVLRLNAKGGKIEDYLATRPSRYRGVSTVHQDRNDDIDAMEIEKAVVVKRKLQTPE